MSNVEVSVIMPSFNSSRFIVDSVKSVMQQSFKNWELVITDDCSTDDTYSILSELAKTDSRIALYQNDKNSGAAVSRNNSIAKSKGRYLAFLDADDIWLPEKLERQLSFMKSGDIAFSFTAYSLIDENGTAFGRTVDLNNVSEVSYAGMLAKKATLGCSTVMIDRTKFPFALEMPNIRTGQDYATWLKILKSGITGHCLNEVLTNYRIVKNSISRNKYKKALRQWQIYRQHEHLGLFKTLYYFAHYALRAVFRR